MKSNLPEPYQRYFDQRLSPKARRELSYTAGALFLAAAGLVVLDSVGDQLPGQNIVSSIEAHPTQVNASPNLVVFYPGVNIRKTPI